MNGTEALPIGLMTLLEATCASGGIPETQWRRLAADAPVDGDVLLQRRLVLRLDGEILATAAGRELVAAYRTPARRIAVTGHAVERALQRHPVAGEADTVRRIIRRDVAEAFKGGRVAKSKPSWWPLLYGQPRSARRLPDGQRFVWNEARRRGFVVVREPDRDVVVTCLHNVGSADTPIE